jgi:GT2 family glycosyltransferase
MPSLYILILNYKTWHDTLECLKSLFGSTFLSFQAVVLDNDSPEKKWELLTDWADDVKIEYTFYPQLPAALPGETPLLFIQNEKNEGFAAGNNFFLRHIIHQDSYVLLLNPDMILNQDSLIKLMTFALAQPFRTLTGITIRDFDRPRCISLYGGGYIDRLTGTVKVIKDKALIHKLSFISGGCLFTHTSHFRETGLLPENYFLYWEETDWCHRALQKGYQLAVCTEAIGYDKGGTSVGRGFLAEYYYTRNGLYFIKKYHPAYLFSVCFFNTFRFFKRLLAGRTDKARGVWKGTFDFLTNRCGKLIP